MTPERLTEIERTFPKNPIVQELVSAVRDAQAQVALLHAGKGESDILAALKNRGVDVTCGACMEIAFTGVTTNEHTCPVYLPVGTITPSRRAPEWDGVTRLPFLVSDVRNAALDAANAHANGSCDPATCPVVAPHHDGTGSIP